MLIHDALPARSPDRIERNSTVADSKVMHDLEDARPTFEPDELTNPESVCHVSPQSVEATSQIRLYDFTVSGTRYPAARGSRRPFSRRGAHIVP
jgi:hypothetical protein